MFRILQQNTQDIDFTIRAYYENNNSSSTFEKLQTHLILFYFEKWQFMK